MLAVLQTLSMRFFSTYNLAFVVLIPVSLVAACWSAVGRQGHQGLSMHMIEQKPVYFLAACTSFYILFFAVRAQIRLDVSRHLAVDDAKREY